MREATTLLGEGIEGRQRGPIRTELVEGEDIGVRHGVGIRCFSEEQQCSELVRLDDRRALVGQAERDKGGRPRPRKVVGLYCDTDSRWSLGCVRRVTTDQHDARQAEPRGQHRTRKPRFIVRGRSRNRSYNDIRVES